ncbi:uncharacterized protein LOC115697917 isoform X2 [Cannabis sativa]|uniref:uncharacterized protein LOC115697917 isoform X2 n=1 Tax=Cannabis sativa TaxID=3483 RepID=UPI0029C9C328|nr:uncharacterized protein LOC115697917 isoform X2 [Cannabis sativa]
MGPDSNAAAASSSSTTLSPGAKRSRDPEDEVYVDNLHSHKRYLSELETHSLKISWNLLPDQKAMYMDEFSLQYSPMSEDSDDSRFCDAPLSTTSSQPESAPSSPVSPYRYNKPLSGFHSVPSTSPHSQHSYGCALATITCSQPRQRSSDSDGRFPSSPSDICHSADLRRAALLRSVQMRTQPLGPSSHFELSFSSEPEHNIEQEEERPCSYMKSSDDEREFHIESMTISDPECSREKPCRVLNMDVKEDHSVD